MNAKVHSNLTIGFNKQKEYTKNKLCRRRVFIFLLLVIFWDMQWTLFWFPRKFQHRIFDVTQAPQWETPAIVLGASVTKRGVPGLLLQERLTVGKNLWVSSKINGLILSGDGRTLFYNEPRAMANWMRNEGIPESALKQDIEGIRTYASLARIKDYHKINKIIIVTSKSHMPRALYLSDCLGIETIGVTPINENRTISKDLYDRVYEYFAIHRALIEQAWIKFNRFMINLSPL